MTLPEWMLDRTKPDVLFQDAGAGLVSALPHPSVLHHAVGNFAHLLEELLANDALAAKRGLLQRIDPRAKILSLLGLLVITTLVSRLTTLLAAYALCLLLAALSRVPAPRLLRAWLVVPLFSAAIMLPALLNVVTPGHPLLTLVHFSSPNFGPWHVPPTLAITDAGLYVAVRFILRASVCVTLALLLTATTPANRLFRGLRALKVPLLFVTLLSMLQRYLLVFVRAAEEIHLAKISRSIAGEALRGEQAWVASGMGSLYRRTQALGESVHQAMIARGYTGETYVLDEPHWRSTDWAFLLLAAGFAALLLLLG